MITAIVTPESLQSGDSRYQFSQKVVKIGGVPCRTWILTFEGQIVAIVTNPCQWKALAEITRQFSLFREAYQDAREKGGAK